MTEEIARMTVFIITREKSPDLAFAVLGILEGINDKYRRVFSRTGMLFSGPGHEKYCVQCLGENIRDL